MPIFMLFFFNNTSTPEFYTLSLHDALPILGHVSDRIVAGTKDGDAPVRFHRGHQAAVKRRQQSSANERRLAATGDSNQREKARLLQPFEQLVTLSIAAEEQMRFLRLEVAQTREGIIWHRRFLPHCRSRFRGR